jgi:enoyl-CoA hydratase/carnithine racemase
MRLAGHMRLAGRPTLITRAPTSAGNIPQNGPAITWVASRTDMPSSHVAWDIKGSVAFVCLNRPEARNALTWEMYDALVEACDLAEAGPGVRVLILRGAPGAFSAGTDISQFENFTGDDGVAYERRLDTVIDRVERLPLITIAEVDGPAVGGGCALALACDLRVCSPRARFGVPVARTLGNCLSIANTARLVDLAGVALAKDLLLTGRLMDAEEARRAGLVHQVCSEESIAGDVKTLAADLSTRARSTVIATKAMMLRLREHRRPATGSADEILRECYGSAEFAEGVAAFLTRRNDRK